MKYLITGVLAVTVIFGSKIKEFIMEKVEDNKERRQTKKNINETVMRAFIISDK